jgi:hypothetical protein
MSDKSNWIERRALREKILDAGGTELWLRVATVLDDSCTYFNEKYPHLGKLGNSPGNGHRIVVTMTFAGPRKKVSYVQFQFEEDRRRISVTVDKAATKHFPIDTDIDERKSRCFVTSASGERLSVDKFAEVTLEDVLFGEESGV